MKLQTNKPIAKTRLLALVGFLAIFQAACSSSSSEDEFLVVKPVVPLEQQQPLAFAVSKPYNINSNYKDVLKKCFEAIDGAECTFNELPLIGQSVISPQISDIMDRVVVSHDWMGVRFEQLLSQLSSEALLLLKPVAVIYIGSENDSVGYNAGSAQLRIGPELLWLTADEKTALASSDGESGGSSNDTRDDLNFRFRYNFIKNGLALDSKESDSERAFSDIFDNFAIVFYSQLAFAADYFPASVYSDDRLSVTPRMIFDENSKQPIVTKPLYDDENLTAPTSHLYPIAKIYYEDEPASDLYKTYTAADAGLAYDSEGKPSLSSYRGERRDMRGLFSLGMMKYKHDVSLNVLFYDGMESNSETTIGYGLRNRIASPKVAARVKFVMERIIGSSASLDEFFQNSLGTTELIEPGTNYEDYLDEIFPPDDINSSETTYIEFDSKMK